MERNGLMSIAVEGHERYNVKNKCLQETPFHLTGLMYSVCEFCKFICILDQHIAKD